MLENNSDLRDRLNAAIPPFKTQVHHMTGTETLAYMVTRDRETIIADASTRSGIVVPGGVSHVFNIGSCTKSIVACAAGLLVDWGRLNWDDPVTQHLPEMNLSLKRDLQRRITIRTLLCHQSGAGEYLTAFVSFSGKPRHRLTRAAELEQFLRVAKHVLEISNEYYDADDPYAYTNIGFAVIAVVIGRVSGMPVQTFIERNIFNAIGMRNSCFNPRQAWRTAPLQYGYVFDGLSSPQQVDSIDYQDSALSTSLGAYSTCEDLTLFFNEVLKGKSGDPTCQLKELDQIFPEGDDKEPYFISSAMDGLKERSYYALGVGIVDVSRSFMRRQSPNSRRSQIRSTESSPTETGEGFQSQGTRWMFYHSGVSRGYNCTFFLHVETKTIVVVMANTTGQGYGADWMAEFLVQKVFNLPCTPPMNDIVGAMRMEAEELRRVQCEAMNLVANAVEQTSELVRADDNSEILGRYWSNDWEMPLTIRGYMSGQGPGPFLILSDKNDEPRPLRRCGPDVYTSLPLTYSDLLMNFTLDFQHLAQFLFKFERSENRHVVGLRWCFSVYGEDPDSVKGIQEYEPTVEHGIWMEKIV